MSAPAEVAEAVLFIDTHLTDLKLHISGSRPNKDRIMELATEIRARAAFVRDWAIRETT